MEKLKMHNFRLKNEGHENISGQLDASRDLLAEEILANITTTPIGKLLRKVAQLPEIRQEKVADIRKRLNNGDYDLNVSLDVAMDRVLEELLM